MNGRSRQRWQGWTGDLALAQEERDRITETIIALQNQRSILDRVKDSAGQMKDDDGVTASA